MTIKAFREQSGAKINISNGTSSERYSALVHPPSDSLSIDTLPSSSFPPPLSHYACRLVTVTGGKESITSAFAAITLKIQQVRIDW